MNSPIKNPLTQKILLICAMALSMSFGPGEGQSNTEIILRAKSAALLEAANQIADDSHGGTTSSGHSGSGTTSHSNGQGSSHPAGSQGTPSQQAAGSTNRSSSPGSGTLHAQGAQKPPQKDEKKTQKSDPDILPTDLTLNKAIKYLSQETTYMSNNPPSNNPGQVEKTAREKQHLDNINKCYKAVYADKSVKKSDITKLINFKENLPMVATGILGVTGGVERIAQYWSDKVTGTPQEKNDQKQKNTLVGDFIKLFEKIKDVVIILDRKAHIFHAEDNKSSIEDSKSPTEIKNVVSIPDGQEQFLKPFNDIFIDNTPMAWVRSQVLGLKLNKDGLLQETITASLTKTLILRKSTSLGAQFAALANLLHKIDKQIKENESSSARMFVLTTDGTLLVTSFAPTNDQHK